MAARTCSCSASVKDDLCGGGSGRGKRHVMRSRRTGTAEACGMLDRSRKFKLTHYPPVRRTHLQPPHPLG